MRTTLLVISTLVISSFSYAEPESRYYSDADSNYYADDYFEGRANRRPRCRYDDRYDDEYHARYRNDRSYYHERDYSNQNQPKPYKDKSQDVKKEEAQGPSSSDEEGKEQDIISDLIESIQESIALIIKTTTKEIWGQGLFKRIVQFIEVFAYAVITKIAFYVLTNPQWVWAYLGRLAGVNNGVRDQLLAGDIWKRFAWKALYGVLVSISLSWVKTFMEDAIGQKKSKNTTLKKVTSVAARTFCIWLAVYEPFKSDENSNIGPTLSCLAILFIFTVAEFTLTSKKGRKATTQKSFMRGIIKGLSSYVAILGGSYALTQFYFKREQNEIDKEKDEIKRLIKNNFYRLQQANPNNLPDNPNNNPNDNQPSGLMFIFNLISNLFGGNSDNDSEAPTFEEFMDEQEQNIQLTAEQQQEVDEEIRSAIEKSEERHKENIKYPLIADGGPRILFVFELVRIALLSKTYQKIKKNVLNNLADNSIDLDNQGINKVKNLFLNMRERWNNAWSSLPKSLKTVTEVTFYNCLIAANPYI